jgi:adenosylcobyric acid synthase
MVLGCTSSAGKSLLVTALARWFVRQGVSVTPFKAQNMSNNARVVDGGEIGVAQWLQALAARVAPTVEMNPVLLKPEANTRSQVIVNGTFRHDLTKMAWRDRTEHLWAPMVSAYESLRSKYDLVILEGAGSPAEINLVDQVNNRMIEYADAQGLLVVDIDRGGAFAHLYGTWKLVPESTRDRLRGYVLNKFRGDATLLEPGPRTLSDLTTMSNVGVLPLLHHELPDEEGATIRSSSPTSTFSVGIIRYPFASNLDEFHVLARGARVRWVVDPLDMIGCDLVVLPGSKHVAADISWLRQQRLDAALVERARRHLGILGICGGAMMLGGPLHDASGVEGSSDGLHILPLSTDFSPDKVTRATVVHFPTLNEPFRALSGHTVSGYEIRNGRIDGHDCEIAPLLWSKGSTLATTVHGLLEDPQLVEAWCGQRPAYGLDTTFEALADAVDEHLDTDLLWRMVDAT